MSVLTFTPKTMPRIILDFGEIVKSPDFPPGSIIYWLEYQDVDIAETVWMGGNYEAAREWQADGVRFIDRRAQ